MYRKPITYTDYNGIEKTENFYFNLTEAELTEMEITTPGGFVEMVQKIVDTKDGNAIIKIFKDLIFKSYGHKTPEGKFRKSEAILEDFISTPAYSMLFMELATNAETAAEFINNVVPAGLAEKAKEMQKNGQLDVVTNK